MIASLPEIHIVDDDEAVRLSMRLSLQAAGFDVQEFRSSREYLDAETTVCDAILVVDQGLPNITGLELLDTLSAAGRSIPAVLISGDSLASSPAAYERECLIACLEKPFRLSSLAELLTEFASGSADQKH